MVITSYICLLNFKLTKIKNSFPHCTHFKCATATHGNLITCFDTVHREYFPNHRIFGLYHRH